MPRCHGHRSLRSEIFWFTLTSGSTGRWYGAPPGIALLHCGSKWPRILINGAGTGNHWLMLSLVGHRSARDAIGAKVTLTTASGRVLHGHVSVSVGFMSSSDKRVHFGLGQESSVKLLEIR